MCLLNDNEKYCKTPTHRWIEWWVKAETDGAADRERICPEMFMS